MTSKFITYDGKTYHIARDEKLYDSLNEQLVREDYEANRTETRNLYTMVHNKNALRRSARIAANNLKKENKRKREDDALRSG